MYMSQIWDKSALYDVCSAVINTKNDTSHVPWIKLNIMNLTHLYVPNLLFLLCKYFAQHNTNVMLVKNYISAFIASH